MVLCLGRDSQTHDRKDLNKAVLNLEPCSTAVTMPAVSNCRNALPGVEGLAEFGMAYFRRRRRRVQDPRRRPPSLHRYDHLHSCVFVPRVMHGLGTRVDVFVMNAWWPRSIKANLIASFTQ